MQYQDSIHALKQIKEQFLRGNTVTIYPKGTSMYPFLLEGRNRVVLEDIRHCVLHRNDVILYQREDSMLVLHRLYRITKDGYYFVGDHQTEVEGPLRSDQLIGKMAGFYRKNGSYCCVQRIDYIFLSRFWLFLRPFRPRIETILHALRTCLSR